MNEWWITQVYSRMGNKSIKLLQKFGKSVQEHVKCVLKFYSFHHISPVTTITQRVARPKLYYSQIDYSIHTYCLLIVFIKVMFDIFSEAIRFFLDYMYHAPLPPARPQKYSSASSLLQRHNYSVARTIQQPKQSHDYIYNHMKFIGHGWSLSHLVLSLGRRTIEWQIVSPFGL